MATLILRIQSFFQKLNELAFSEQTDVTGTPETAPHKGGLLALAYRLMTAPFIVRTPKNVTTRTGRRKSSPTKLVSITETTSPSAQNWNQSKDLKAPPLNGMFLLNAHCEKSIIEEVQFYSKNYQDFISSDNQKLIAVICALNNSNLGHYNDLRIRYPGFLLEPPVIVFSPHKYFNIH